MLKERTRCLSETGSINARFEDILLSTSSGSVMCFGNLNHICQYAAISFSNFDCLVEVEQLEVLAPHASLDVKTLCIEFSG